MSDTTPKPPLASDAILASLANAIDYLDKANAGLQDKLAPVMIAQPSLPQPAQPQPPPPVYPPLFDRMRTLITQLATKVDETTAILNSVRL